MREIKFRAWEERRSKWFFFGGIFNCRPYMFVQDELSPEYPDLIIEQFTGLKDKKGREIYENDCFYRNGHIGYVFQKLSGEWALRFDDNKIVNLLSDFKWNWTAIENEVIGNIHENPELLK